MTDDSEIRRAALLRAQAGHDGELDAANALALERDLAADEGLRRAQASGKVLRATLRAHFSRESAPEALRKRVLALAESQAPPRTSRLEPRAMALAASFVAVAFLAGWMMFTTLCQLFGDWRRVTRVLPYKIAGGLQVLPWLLGMTILLLKFPGKIDVIQRLTDLLPSNLPTLIALLAPILAVLYWCVDTVFSQIEVVGAPTPPGQT